MHWYCHNCTDPTDVEVISLVNNSLSLITKDIPKLPKGLRGLQGTKIPNGDLLLCGGGKSWKGKCNEYLLLKDGSDQWERIGTSQTKRLHHSSVFIDGCLFTTGAYNIRLPFLNHEEFSFEGGVKEKMDMPIFVYGHTATIFSPGKLLICGGRDKNVRKNYLQVIKTKLMDF